MTRSVDALYHAIPLHYVPALLAAGALYAQSVLVSPNRPASLLEGIVPRSTATKRDRALGLDDYVHLSPTPKMPLLADKLAKGYPHAQLIFDGLAILGTDGRDAHPTIGFGLPSGGSGLSEVAVLPYNTKAWRTRACYAPVTDRRERDELLGRYLEGNRLPSLEILVKYGLPLTHLVKIAFVDDRERGAVARCVDKAVEMLVVDPDMFPITSSYAPAHWEVIQDYFNQCRAEGRVLSPPTVPFD